MWEPSVTPTISLIAKGEPLREPTLTKGPHMKMKHLIVAAAALAAAASANAVVTLSGGTYVTFTGYSTPPVQTAPQSSGLENALLSGGPLDRYTATFLGKEAAH